MLIHPSSSGSYFTTKFIIEGVPEEKRYDLTLRSEHNDINKYSLLLLPSAYRLDAYVFEKKNKQKT